MDEPDKESGCLIPEKGNPYGMPLLKELHSIQGGEFDFEDELIENGFSAVFDPLEHDEACYDELALKMPRFGRALKDWAKSELAGVLETLDEWLEKAGLSGAGEPEGLDDARDRIEDGMARLEDSGADTGRHPYYGLFVLVVNAAERNGGYELCCDFDGNEAKVFVNGKNAAKDIDAAFASIETKNASRPAPKA